MWLYFAIELWMAKHEMQRTHSEDANNIGMFGQGLPLFLQHDLGRGEGKGKPSKQGLMKPDQERRSYSQ